MCGTLEPRSITRRAMPPRIDGRRAGRCCCRRPALLRSVREFRERAATRSASSSRAYVDANSLSFGEMHDDLARRTQPFRRTGGGRSTAGCLPRSVMLMVIGIVLAWPAARRSPSGSASDDLPLRQPAGALLVPAVAVLIATSFLTPRQVRRAALVAFILGWRLIDRRAVLFGQEVKGARRWIFRCIQPSEFLKPAFVVLAAWAFSEGAQAPRRARHNCSPSCCCRSPSCRSMLQPDFGQTMLISARLGGAVLHGRPALVLGRRARRASASAGAMLAYKLVPHVRGRIRLHRSRRPAAVPTRFRSTPRCEASSAAAGSARGRAKDAEAHPARQPYRFHLRGGRRGVRHHRLHGARRAVSPSSCCAG